jgi:DNA-directed RNA polymerase specialized sigma24 family protein
MTPIGERGDGEEDRLHFERCFRDHYADLLAFALRRVAERQTAEDVVAETLAVVWRRRELIPDPPLRVTHNVYRRP